jgi:hypothetical protein
MPERAYEQSECSDDSVDTLNDMHKSGMCSDNCRETLSDVDDEPDGSDSVLVMDEPTNNDMISSKDAVGSDASKYIITSQLTMTIRWKPTMVKNHPEMTMRVNPGMVMSHTIMDCTTTMMAIGGCMTSTPVSATILAIVDNQSSSTGQTWVKSLCLGSRRMPPMMMMRRNSPTMMRMRRMKSMMRKHISMVNRHMNKGHEHQQVVVQYFISILIFVKLILILIVNNIVDGES